jgi:hypothetical protein
LIKKNNISDTRIVNLDFLRGFFVVLAMFEHYSFFLSKWYIENFKEFAAVKTTYISHFAYLGKSLPADKVLFILGAIFIPWVSQVYLALASFNIAKNTQEKLKENIGPKAKMLLVLLGIFYVENFLVSYDFGQAISFYPIMLWMVVLLVINLVYAYSGVKGVVFLTFISLTRFMFPMEAISDGFENMMKIYVHPSFDYDARIEYFITSGCIGFLLGYLHHQKKETANRKDLILFVLGLFLVVIYYIFPNEFLLDAHNAYHYEHEHAKTILGSLYLWGIEISVISLFLYLERKNIKFNSKFFNWVGYNSLFIFLCHKLFFLRIVMPITLFIYAQLGWGLSVTFYEMISYTLIVLFMCWVCLKFKIATLITREDKVN